VIRDPPHQYSTPWSNLHNNTIDPIICRGSDYREILFVRSNERRFFPRGSSLIQLNVARKDQWDLLRKQVLPFILNYLPGVKFNSFSLINVPIF